MRLEIVVLSRRVRLPIPPVAVEHILARLDQPPATLDSERVHLVCASRLRHMVQRRPPLRLASSTLGGSPHRRSLCHLYGDGTGAGPGNGRTSAPARPVAMINGETAEIAGRMVHRDRSRALAVRLSCRRPSRPASMALHGVGVALDDPPTGARLSRGRNVSDPVARSCASGRPRLPRARRFARRRF